MDRAAHLRTNKDKLVELRKSANAKITLVWRRRSLVLSDPKPCAHWIDPDTAAQFEEHIHHWIFLGMQGGCPHFAADISSHEDPKPLVAPGHFRNLHAAGIGMSKADFTVLGYAQGMLGFNKRHQRCTKCGEAVEQADAGFARACPACKLKVFPRSDPAVMILVTRGDLCLLARQPGFPPGMFSALAGFVEPGESLEDCVVRETKEEVGLDIGNIRYFGSQGWPFPQSIMVAFTVDTEQTEVRLDTDELEEARWLTREEVRASKDFFIPPPFSLAHHLINRFLES